MHELVEAVKAWPVIVQGALGSALFWLVLLFGQRAAHATARRYSHISKNARMSWLINEQTKCLASIAKPPEAFATFAIILLYRSSRHVLKALMWLVLGLLASTLSSWLGCIGFVGCLYYLFKAYEVVAPLDSEAHNEARLVELNAEYKKLDV